MLIGVHESVAGGLEKAFALGEVHGIEALQIFTKNASQWKEPVLSREQSSAFRAAHAAWGGGPVIAHDSYLVNLCSDREDILARSRASLFAEMERCDALGVGCVAFHPGASMGLGKEAAIARVGESLAALLERGAGMSTRLAIENTAGQGSALAWSIDEIASIIACAGPLRDRLGVCLDTQHLFAAGYDLRSAAGYDAFFDEFERKVGTQRICSFHLNDSKKGLGERVDRHAEIGRGEIGLYPFWRLLHDPRFTNTPGVIELPPDDAVASLEALRRLRAAPDPPELATVAVASQGASDARVSAPLPRARRARARG